MASTELPPKQPPPSKEEASKTLKKKILHRQASLTEGESAFLHALLIDPPAVPANKDIKTNGVRFEESDESEHSKQMMSAAKKLDDDVLFSLPFEKKEVTNEPAKLPPKSKRRQSNWIGLWKAFEDGVHPKALADRAPPKPKEMPPKEIIEEKSSENVSGESPDDDSIRSDEEVRIDRTIEDGASVASSWDDSEGAPEHYDAWAVLKDEYAEDFGFDYSLRSSLSPEISFDEGGNTFKILGTSADDKSAQPHVLSPPLMDSLMNFLPEGVSKQNWWLKYSLVRDGASLNTFRQYVRGAQYTVLAIETAQGDVFGAFTGSHWRLQYGFYGSGEAFLWKMRYNRMTPCSSLFEQAQMETDIDVYFYSSINRFVQLCTNDMLAVGGGALPEGEESEQDDVNSVTTPTNVHPDVDESPGFGIALEENLLRGTSSPCGTFRNPCLIHHSSHGETFEVVNMEAWAFTPCYDVDSAEKLEMTKFFLQESIRTESLHSLRSESSTHDSPSVSSLSTSPMFGLEQKRFYRRVGDSDRSEERRDRWQRGTMM